VRDDLEVLRVQVAVLKKGSWLRSAFTRFRDWASDPKTGQLFTNAGKVVKALIETAGDLPEKW